MINFARIRLVAFDVDGVLTDGHYYVSETGKVKKSFYTRDFYAIEQLLKNEIYVLIITQSHDLVILSQIHRICDHSGFWRGCWKKDGIRYETGINDKYEKLKEIMQEKKIRIEDVAYMGDAENDLECMKKVAITACPSDAIDIIKENSNYISDYDGGHGCVYDFVMYILKEREKE